MNLSDDVNGTEFCPEATHHIPVSKKWREALWRDVCKDRSMPHVQEAMQIIFTSNHMSKSLTLRKVFLCDAPLSFHMQCCHFHLSVIAAFYLCNHHCSIVIVFAYGLELQILGYIKHNFALVWYINVLWARDGGWFVMRGLDVTCHLAPSTAFQHLQ